MPRPPSSPQGGFLTFFFLASPEANCSSAPLRCQGCFASLRILPYGRTYALDTSLRFAVLKSWAGKEGNMLRMAKLRAYSPMFGV